ncbi:MAG: hypothetical protein LBI34_01320 [Puniceicoccales bacterium]|nr:hypothetical protein [Puniceicoccales bacterium]
MEVSFRGSPVISPYVSLNTFPATSIPRDPKMITISREQEINALRCGERLASDPGRRRAWTELVALPARDFEAKYSSNAFEQFASGWVIVGQKPGGVEGGCIIRRIWTDADENFESGSGAHAVVMELHANGQLGMFQRRTVEESLEALHCADRTDSAFERIYEAVRYGNEFDKSFMVKILFGENGIQGDVYYCPNARNAIHKQWTARHADELRNATLEEYVALRVAKALSSETVPEARLGQVDTDGWPRHFVMTEIGGCGSRGEVVIKTANTIDQQINEQNFDKAAFEDAYAITIGLLNDWDANADSNVGVMSADGRAKRPFLFDLGHASPAELSLDAETLMPLCRTNGLNIDAFWQRVLRIIAIFIGCFRFSEGKFFTNPNFMTAEDRARALQNLVDRQELILRTMEELEGQLLQDEDSQRTIQSVRTTLGNRLSYIQSVLDKHYATR